MEAEVSTLFCPRFNSKCRNFGRDRHYCPPSNEFCNFQVMPSSPSMMSVKIYELSSSSSVWIIISHFMRQHYAFMREKQGPVQRRYAMFVLGKDVILYKTGTTELYSLFSSFWGTDQHTGVSSNFWYSKINDLPLLNHSKLWKDLPGQLLIALILPSSVATPLAEITCPR